MLLDYAVSSLPCDHAIYTSLPAVSSMCTTCYVVHDYHFYVISSLHDMTFEGLMYLISEFSFKIHEYNPNRGTFRRQNPYLFPASFLLRLP